MTRERATCELCHRRWLTWQMYQTLAGWRCADPTQCIRRRQRQDPEPGQDSPGRTERPHKPRRGTGTPGRAQRRSQRE